MSFDPTKITNPFVKLHLDYVYHTEPPLIFHTWAAIACVAACMQRGLWLDTGIGPLYGNMFVMLVGPPGTRKSTALTLAAKNLLTATDIRIAPDDTGGQRQGLLKALIEDVVDIEGLESAEANDIDRLMDVEMSLDTTNRHVMFVLAKEFGSFIGHNSLDLTRFLIRMWDGENYKYRLRDSVMEVKDALLTMAGATTPSDIATLMPAEAMGQGYMSRNILVYAGHKAKEVKPSEVRLDGSCAEDLQRVYARVSKRMRGALVLDKHALELLDNLYLHDTRINDTRFQYYSERRHTHLMKLAMALTVARDAMIIQQQDVEEAQRILVATEAYMPDALGEYGLSPLAVAQQKLLDFLRLSREPVSEHVLFVVMQRDMKPSDFKTSLAQLINSGKVTAMDAKNGRNFVFNDATARAIATMGEDALDALLDDMQQTRVLQ